MLGLVRVRPLPAAREGLYDGFYDGHAETDNLRARRRLHDRLRRLAVHTSEQTEWICLARDRPHSLSVALYEEFCIPRRNIVLEENRTQATW